MSYKLRAVRDLCKLHVEGESDVLHHVDPDSLDFRFSVQAVLPAEVPDDGVRLSHLDVTWVGSIAK